MVRSALLIAGNDLRRRMRNRSFIVQAIVGPLLLALVISAAFSGGFGFEVKIGVVDEDGSELSTAIHEGLVEGDVQEVELVSFDDRAAAIAELDHDEIDAVLVLPAGFGASLARPEPVALQVISDEENIVASAVGRAIAQGISARVDAGRLTAFSLALSGQAVPRPEELASTELPISIADQSPGEELSPAALVAPGLGLLFLFFTVAGVARGLLEERRQKVLDRMLAAPLRLSAVLLGKALTIFALGLVSLGTLWGVTTLLFGAAWGDPAAVALVLVAATLAIAGISAVVAAFARDEQTAELVATAIAFVLGTLGGSLVPLSELPEGFVRASLFTPNGWAQRALAELSAGEGDVVSVLPEVGALLVWAVVALALAAAFVPRRLAR